MSKIKDDLTINKFALDEEWLKQPSLVDKYSVILAELIESRDIAAEKLEVVKSQIASDIRSNPSDYDIQSSKPTDANVKEIVNAHPDVLEAAKVLREWEYEVSTGFGVRKALEHKRAALEDLTKLYLSGYWASPYISREEREEIVKNAQKYSFKNERMEQRAKQRRSENG